MIATGALRVDLSEFVADGVLYLGEKEIRAVYTAISGSPADVPVELFIGSARHVWRPPRDPRLAEELSRFDLVTVTGTDGQGIAHAVVVLRNAVDELRAA